MAGVDEFFKAVLPGDGWFYVAAVVDARKCKHNGFLTSKATEAARWAASRWQTQNKHNTYFTPCTWTQQYTQNAEGKNKNCRKHKDLVYRIKSFWLDLDCRKLGVSEKDFLRIVFEFCRKISLPAPNAIVRTGGGLHVYWGLDTELTLAQWQPLAEALKHACKMHEVEADHVCTSDYARIMRLPGSVNFKYPDAPQSSVIHVGPPVSLAKFSAALQRFKAPTAEEQHCNDEFSGGVQYEKGRMELVVAQCPLLAEVAADAGARCSEPLWKGVIHLCAHAADGQEWAHKLSSGHAGYSQKETDNKLIACDVSIPPTRCATLQGAYWAEEAPCTTCPHNGKIKGPMMLGRAKDEGTVVPPLGLPAGYIMTRAGVYRVKKPEDPSEEEELIRVTQVPIVEVSVHDVIESDGSDAKVVPHIHMVFMDGKGRRLKGTFPMSVLPDYRSLYGALSSIRFPLTRHDHKNGFDTLMTSWVQQLREHGEVTVGKPQFGWHFKGHDEIEGFAIGKTMYLPDGTSKVMMWPESQLNHVYTTAGTLEAWKEAVELIGRRKSPELMTLLAGAFAAPLFTFLGESSAVVSAVSRESGVGKSSALKVAQAVWGDPKAGISSLDDTPKSVARKMGIIKHLPVFWDELRLNEENSQEFLQMMFQLSQGRERTRLTSGVDFRDVGTWETILVCASNNHLADLAYDPVSRTNANLKRLFEYDIAYDGEAPRATDGTEVFNNLRFNYGHAGVIYVKFLVQNAKKVQSDVLAMYRALFDQVGAKNEDRFWVGTMACLLLGARYAKQLDLVKFDLISIKNFLIRAYSSMQKIEDEVRDMDVSVRLLSEFLRENEGASAVYRNSKPRPGKHTPDMDIVVQRPPSDTRQGLVWEYFSGSGTLRISRYPFHDFLKRRKHRPKEFLQEIEEHGYVYTESRFLFGNNTRYAAVTRAYAYEFTIPPNERDLVATERQEKRGEA